MPKINAEVRKYTAIEHKTYLWMFRKFRKKRKKHEVQLYL